MDSLSIEVSLRDETAVAAELSRNNDRDLPAEQAAIGYGVSAGASKLSVSSGTLSTQTIILLHTLSTCHFRSDHHAERNEQERCKPHPIRTGTAPAGLKTNDNALSGKIRQRHVC